MATEVPHAPRAKRDFRMEAHAVRIYGVLRQEAPDINVSELSRRLGIPRITVSRILRTKGWRVHSGPLVNGQDHFADLVDLFV